MRGRSGVADRARIFAVCTVLALGMMGCPAEPDRASTSSAMTAADSAEATPAPGWADSAAIADADSAEIATHIAALRFDTTDGIWDEQRLMVLDGGTRRHGVLARIEPEIGSARLTRSQVEDGRIIARITVRAPDERTGMRSYATLGIVESVSYLYVKKFPAVGTRAGYWRAYMLGASGRSSVPLQLDVLNHPRRNPLLSIARWQWSETDERAWGTCGPDCCSAWQLTASPS